MSLGTQVYNSSFLSEGTCMSNYFVSPRVAYTFRTVINRTCLSANGETLQSIINNPTTAENQAILSDLYNNTETTFTFMRGCIFHQYKVAGDNLYSPYTGYAYDIVPLSYIDTNAEVVIDAINAWVLSPAIGRYHIELINGSYYLMYAGYDISSVTLGEYVTVNPSYANVPFALMIYYNEDNGYYYLRNWGGLIVPSTDTTSYENTIVVTNLNLTGIENIVCDPDLGWISDIATQLGQVTNYLKGAYDMSDQINPEIGNKKGMLSNSDSFVSILECTDAQLTLFKQLANTGVFLGNVGRYIVSYKILYVPEAIGTSAEQTIFTRTFFNESWEFKAQYVNYQMNAFNLGSYNFTEYYNSFLDYEPYTQISIFLPFCGYQKLDPSLVMDGTLNIKCVVDVLTGNVTYYGIVTKDGLTNVLYTWNGNCAIEVPMTMEDYGSKAVRLLSSVVTSSAMISSGGMTAAPLAIANTTENILSPTINSTGSIVANNGLGGVLYPYVIIQRTPPKYPVSYAEDIGKPCMKDLSFSICNGFTKVKEVHLTGITGAFKEEIDEMEQMLKEGVIF